MIHLAQLISFSFDRAKRSRALCLGFFVIVSCVKCLSGNSQGILQVESINQLTRMWCWAASGQMVMSYLGTNVQQCVQADIFFSLNDCCSYSDSECVNGGWPEFEKFGFEYDHTVDAPLTFSQIQHEINSGRPIAFSWHWCDEYGNDDGGHMMVIYGWEIDDNVEYVWVHDPNSEYEGQMAYEAYVSGDEYRHWNDFFNIKKASL